MFLGSDEGSLSASEEREVGKAATAEPWVHEVSHVHHPHHASHAILWAFAADSCVSHGSAALQWKTQACKEGRCGSTHSVQGVKAVMRHATGFPARV